MTLRTFRVTADRIRTIIYTAIIEVEADDEDEAADIVEAMHDDLYDKGTVIGEDDNTETSIVEVEANDPEEAQPPVVTTQANTPPAAVV